MQRAWLAILLAFSAAGMQGQSRSDASRSGAKLFRVYCQKCHSTARGKKSLGPGLYHIMKSKRFDEPRLREMITNGKDTMPPFGRRLSAEELDRLIEYLKAL
ncbi:MAG TPA: cytochrome c [Terriglobales bacterium]|nr:cytochrome c [Terriglobales bacterium]